MSPKPQFYSFMCRVCSEMIPHKIFGRTFNFYFVAVVYPKASVLILHFLLSVVNLDSKTGICGILKITSAFTSSCLDRGSRQQHCKVSCRACSVGCSVLRMHMSLWLSN